MDSTTHNSLKMPEKLRKAAIVISTLDTAAADRLLDQMPPEQAACIRRAIMELDEINSDEQELVIHEFLRGPTAVRPANDEGVEFDPGLLRRFAHSSTDETPVSSAAQRGRFGFLQEASCDVLGRLLQREHPQIAAVVLSHLPPDKAAAVLVLFSRDLQSAVLRRVAELDTADPEVLQDLEAELEAMFLDHVPSGVRSTGLTAVHAILGAVENTDRQHILEHLQRRDQDLAARLHRSRAPENVAPHSTLAIRSPAHATATATTAAPAAEHSLPHLNIRPLDVSFADVTQLGSTELAKLFHRCDPQVTLLALTGAEESFVEKLLAQLPLRDAKLLRRRMQQLGPILLRDVERAQQQLADVAGRLAAEGIIPLQAKGFAAAA